MEFDDEEEESKNHKKAEGIWRKQKPNHIGFDGVPGLCVVSRDLCINPLSYF